MHDAWWWLHDEFVERACNNDSYSALPFIELPTELFEGVRLADAHRAPVLGAHDHVVDVAREGLVERVNLIKVPSAPNECRT